MLILGIETSCDETAAAVVADGRRVLSDIVATQFDLHGAYGGVVPELAARRHQENILPVIRAALAEAGVTLQELHGIAVTQGPGLIGALVIGFAVAKSLAYGLDLPLAGVHHLEAHIMAPFLTESAPAFPFIALVVSGGHTNLYKVDGVREMTLLGRSRDDAAGEAFDKVAKLMHLGYPGGIAIENSRVPGEPESFCPAPAPDLQEPLTFSYSGLKTAVATLLRKNPEILSIVPQEPRQSGGQFPGGGGGFPGKPGPVGGAAIRLPPPGGGRRRGGQPAPAPGTGEPNGRGGGGAVFAVANIMHRQRRHGGGPGISVAGGGGEAGYQGGCVCPGVESKKLNKALKATCDERSINTATG